ncbi:MAG: hypothetical protein C0597_04015 [Marinilabiliales bacterium]|nr:MAG: hypothetical protein C0597_04015 [Marinilabiliales bacterium]
MLLTIKLLNPTNMKHSFRVNFTLLLILILTAKLSINAQDISIKIGFRDSLSSKILNENRTILIHLPDEYNEKQSYPVLYRLDGNPELLMETISTTNRLIYGDELIPEMIIVAIENVNRPRDMWPTNTMYYPETETAGAKVFLDFIEKELIPHV